MADPDSSSSVQHPDSVGQLVRIHSGVKALWTIINCQRNKTIIVRETIPSEKFYENQWIKHFKNLHLCYSLCSYQILYNFDCSISYEEPRPHFKKI